MVQNCVRIVQILYHKAHLIGGCVRCGMLRVTENDAVFPTPMARIIGEAIMAVGFNPLPCDQVPLLISLRCQHSPLWSRDWKNLKLLLGLGAPPRTTVRAASTGITRDLTQKSCLVQAIPLARTYPHQSAHVFVTIEAKSYRSSSGTSLFRRC